MRIVDADTIRSALLRAAPLTAVLVLAACGGGGGGGGGGTGGGSGGESGGDSLTELDSLSGVPANDNWLFYTSNAEGNAGLFAINPLDPDDGAKLVDADAYLNANPYVFHAISSGDIVGSEISDYRARYLFYRSKEEETSSGMPVTRPNGFQRVSAAQSVNPDTPGQVSSESDPTNLFFTRAFFQNDLDTPGNTAFAYRTSQSWRQIRVGDDVTQAPDEFNANHQVMVSLGNGVPNGWLAIDEGTSNQLVMVDMDLTDHGYVPDHNGNPVDGLEQVDMFVNLGLDAQLVVLTFEDPDPSDDVEAPPPEMWLYTLGNPGTIEPLLNGDGDRLTFTRNLFGQGASLPPADKLVIRDDVLYFAHPADPALFLSTGPQLYRVDRDGWSVEVSHHSDSGTITELVPASPFLIDAGDRLIWRIGDELKGIDTNDFSESTLYAADSEASTTILDSQGGWFFYNDDGTAVAARTDGSERIQLHDARWIGASSRGEGPVATRLAKSEISEVFLLHDDGTLVAASASSPDAGGVVLGQLDPAPEAVRMFGIRPGPHQLMQVHYAGDTDRYEVVYVDSREPGSLRQLMVEPTDVTNAASRTRPVYGH